MNSERPADPRTAGDGYNRAWWRWVEKQLAAMGQCSAPYCLEPAVHICPQCHEARCASHCLWDFHGPDPDRQVCFLVGHGIHKSSGDLERTP